jgi:uncharacterized Zn finger protein
MSYLLSTLRSATVERHNRAVRGLNDGSLRITLVHRDDARIDALVRSHTVVYEVSLTDRHLACTCPDFAFRSAGTACKHALATAIYCLSHPHQQANCIHLASADGTLFCDEENPARVWYRPSESVTHFADMVCPTCLAQRLQPAPLTRDEHYFSEAQIGRAA